MELKQLRDLRWAVLSLDMVRNRLLSEGRQETDDPATCDTALWNLRTARDSIEAAKS